jgi:hypothetical protein
MMLLAILSPLIAIGLMLALQELETRLLERRPPSPSRSPLSRPRPGAAGRPRTDRVTAR